MRADGAGEGRGARGAGGGGGGGVVRAALGGGQRGGARPGGSVVGDSRLVVGPRIWFVSFLAFTDWARVVHLVVHGHITISSQSSRFKASSAQNELELPIRVTFLCDAPRRYSRAQPGTISELAVWKSSEHDRPTHAPHDPNRRTPRPGLHAHPTCKETTCKVFM